MISCRSSRLSLQQRLSGYGCDLAAQLGHIALAVRVDAIAEKDHRRPALRIEPDRRASEAGVPEADALGKHVAAIRRKTRHHVPAVGAQAGLLLAGHFARRRHEANRLLLKE